jgi:hypothetical protein
MLTQDKQPTRMVVIQYFQQSHLLVAVKEVPQAEGQVETEDLVVALVVTAETLVLPEVVTYHL